MESAGVLANESGHTLFGRTGAVPRVGRDPQLDALKGIAIILVVFGHALSFQVGSPAERTPLGIAIWAVHMPLFAFVSGLVTRPIDQPLRFVIRRARQLLVPYLCWTLIGAAIAGGGLLAVLRTTAQALVYPRTSLWFLHSLFVCCALLAATAPRGWRFVAAAAVLLLPVQLLPLPDGFLGVYDVMVLFPYFAAGYYVAQRAVTPRRVRLLPVVACLSVYMLLLWLRASSGSPFEPDWYLALARMMEAAGLPGASVVLVGANYLLGAAGVAFLYLISPVLAGVLRSILAFLGLNTLGIYALQNWALSELAGRTGMRGAVPLTLLAVGATAGASALLGRVPIARELLLGRMPAKARTS